MADVVIDAALFATRLKKLHANFVSNREASWNGCDALVIAMGASSEEELNYSKSSALHLYLLGFEFSDSIMILTKTTFCFMATNKKCGYVEAAIQAHPVEGIKFEFFRKTKDEGANRENFNAMLGLCRKAGNKVGTLLKAHHEGVFIPLWTDALTNANIPVVEIAPCMAVFFAVKDETEMESCKRAAVLTNKVMKHGFVSEMEKILDDGSRVTHEAVAKEIEKIIFDPSKIDLKVPKDVVDICYTPIVQSGGVYDIKVSAVSNDSYLSSDVVLCSLGARYKNYCANVSRTFMVDPCKKIEDTYTVLLAMYDACLAKCVPGCALKSVHEEAHAFLQKKHPALEAHLPKSFGFITGLEFRDGSLVLNATNNAVFQAGMTVNFSVGLHSVPLTAEDTDKSPESIKKLQSFSLLLADTISVQREGPAEIMTKFSKDLSSVSYNLGDGDDDDDKEELGTMHTEDGLRRSTRGLDERQVAESNAATRAVKQKELMARKVVEAKKRLAKSGSSNVEEEEDREAQDLVTYRSPEEYPRDLMPNQVKVDLEHEALIVPIGGRPVPFHISTIKSVLMPEPDRATYMRINFYAPGATLGKESSVNMQLLVAKYGPTNTFIKELTYRSLDSRNLTTAYRMFQELRKRVRQREQKAEQEKDLVVQDKLVRIKDQRVPRLQDLTMRPNISSKKCVGALEAHQNGLRFTSHRGEVLDVMYDNIKHAFFQPCENTLMVLLHFHFKNPIMIGKKKCNDVQFMTEVIQASLNLDGARRSAYDPDELEEEQREREMRKRLNMAFKDFCKKVERVATHYSFNVEFDIPYSDMGFKGNVHRDMVFIQPTVHCLVNLTEQPVFVTTLAEVEHVHFERVSRATKNFDMTLIFRDWDVPPRTVTLIELKNYEKIQDWLNDVDLTYTEGGLSMNWSNVMKEVKADDRFYEDTDHDGVKKPAGWAWLSADADSDEEDDEEDAESEYDSESDEDESESDEESGSDDESSYASDELESDYDEDAEGELEEQGMDWDELEKEAAVQDKQKRARGEDADSDDERKRKQARAGGGKRR